jgi:hypothetical protein
MNLADNEVSRSWLTSKWQIIIIGRHLRLWRFRGLGSPRDRRRSPLPQKLHRSGYNLGAIPLDPILVIVGSSPDRSLDEDGAAFF